MRALSVRVARTIRQDCRAGAGDRVVAAVSGGSDSVGLAWVLAELAARDRGPALVGLVHVNHQLRGSESDADEAFCRALADRLKVPIAVATLDVASRARDARTSIEVAAREARYEFFGTAVPSLGATLLATGHTMDDQAETVMLRLLRGAGTRGLSGVRARRGHVIRPLLHCRRADVRNLLVARGETWREDASNNDVAILRNRIRHELMPVLTGIAPGGVQALARLAQLAQDDEAALTRASTEVGPALVLSNGDADGRIEVDALALSLMPPALARRVIRTFAADVAPGRNWASRHFEAVRSLAASDKLVGHLDLPGVLVEKRDGRLVLTPVASATAC